MAISLQRRPSARSAVTAWRSTSRLGLPTVFPVLVLPVAFTRARPARTQSLIGFRSTSARDAMRSIWMRAAMVLPLLESDGQTYGELSYVDAVLAALKIVLAVLLVGVRLPSGAGTRTEVVPCSVPSQPSIKATAKNVDLAQGILNGLAGIFAPGNVDVGVAVGGLLLEERSAQTLLKEHLGSGGSGPGFDAKRKRLEQKIRENELSMATLGAVLGRSLLGPLGGKAGGASNAPAAVGKGAVPTAAAKNVDLVTPARRRHILDGDATGGGHRPGLGKPGKSEFPKGWDDNRIIHEISDVATDPAAVRTPGRGGRTVVEGTRDGVQIRVIVERDGSIVTGFPTNTPRNP